MTGSTSVRVPQSLGEPQAATRDPAQSRSAADRTWTTLALVGFLCVAGLVIYRAATRLDLADQSRALGIACSDFRDAIYYPVVSFLDGHNPYDVISYTRDYPVGDIFPVYLPSTLLWHLPFGLLPVTAAALAYVMLTTALIPVLAYLTLRLCDLRVSAAGVFGLALLMLLSRPGYWTIFLGQYTVTITLGLFAAIYFARRRPALAVVGFAVACMKPTYGVPLAILMLAGGHFRVVIGGALAAAAVSAIVLVVLIYDVGVASFVDSVMQNLAGFAVGPDTDPSTSTYRADAVAFVSRFLGHPVSLFGEIGILIGILGVSAVGVFRLERSADDDAAWLSVCLMSLAVVVCTYHQSYDLLMLAVPLVGLATARWQGPAWLRWALLAVLGVPAFNYLASEMIISRVGAHGAWWLGVASLNGGTLLLAFAAYAALALRRTL